LSEGYEYDIWTTYEKTESAGGERGTHVSVAGRIQYNVSVAASYGAPDRL